MTGKYRNKYRIATARASFWDYGWNAAYFVTLCTKNREHWFGEIVENQPGVALSAIGEIAQQCWLAIPDHFPFVELDAHVVMPNHVHGIIIIDKPDNDRRTLETQNFASLPRNVSNPQMPKNRFGPQSKNLGSVIRGFKIGVTKNARKIHPDFAWQSRYHDHIIRDDTSHQRITTYIMNNPSKWKEDTFFNS